MAANVDPNASVEAVLAQIAQAQASDPQAFASDALTKAILDKLNEEVARVYAEAEAAGEKLDEDEGEEGGDDGGDGGGDGGGGGGGANEGGEEEAAARRERAAASGVQLRKGPLPVDLWKSAHEVPAAPKERVVLTSGAWSELVARLNESSRKKQLHLLKAQHRQIANQLSGLTFAPQISERSRELAAMNKSLPERVAALMIKKKSKLDRIRMEKAERELAEATFKPVLNAPRRRGDDGAAAAADAERRVGHLLQYEIDRRVRAEQRKVLIEEMENKALTFNPAINKNSVRIVSRMQREAAERAALAGSAGADAAAGDGPGSPGGGGGVGTATSVSASMSKAAAERKKVEAILLGRAPKGLGRSHLPGHEEETFTPAISARSRALASDRAVHERLYGARKLPEPEAEEKVRAAHARDEAGLPAAAAPGASTGPHGEPGPGHPQFFNAVPWQAAPHDFLLRRLLAVPPV